MKRAPFLVLAAGLLGAILLAPASVSLAADIRVCENANMRGPCVDLRHGVNDLRDWGVSNSISSFSIGSGTWLMCTEPNFGGRCEAFSDSVSNLRGSSFQDRISSIRPIREGGGGNWGGWGGEEQWRRIGIAVYSDSNFRGRSWVFTDDIRDLSRMGMNNQISSVRVYGGRWRLCRTPNFGGCIDVTSDISNLRDIGFNDQVSSIQEVGPGGGRPDGGWGGGGPGGGWGSGSGGGGRVFITVYSDKGFSGRSWNFEKDVRNLGAMGMGNQISSVKVAGGRWRLCRTSSFEGCVEVGEDVYDLRDLGMNDQVNSIELVRSGGGWGGGGGGWGGGSGGSGGGWGGSGGGPRDEAILYEQPGFRGRSVTITGESSNLRDQGFNDKAMSIRIRGTWQLCSDAKYRGQCISVEGDQEDLGRIGIARNLSSIRKER